MPYSPSASQDWVFILLTITLFTYFLFITSNFYSQFRLTQTYGLNVFFFVFFLLSFFGKSVSSLHTFICPNVPKICLKLAYTVVSVFIYLFWVSRDLLLFLLFLLRVFILFANEMIISFRFLRCLRSSVSVSVSAQQMRVYDVGENVDLIWFTIFFLLLQERSCLSNETAF